MEGSLEAIEFADMEESSTGEALWTIREEIRRNPLPINQLERESLESLQLLNDLQLNFFFEYRNLLGSFLSIYELQAIPGWDLETIRNLRPYLTMENPFRMNGKVLSSMFKGTHNLLVRVGGNLGNLRYSRWRKLPGDRGNLLKTMIRYKYASNPFLEIGFTGEKDAGEAFLTKSGFDFNSVHFFGRKMGHLKALALGDYTVSMGQGLIQWQGMAFHKSVAIAQIKRQGPVLAPYRSAGEFGFQRGLGFTLGMGKWECSVFGSYRHLDARLEMDSSLGFIVVRSVLSTGYHVSEKDLSTRNNLLETSAGSVLKFRGKRGTVSLNGMSYHFSQPIYKEEGELYRLFSLQGKTWGALSSDYAINLHNLHLFGEFAIDFKRHPAFIGGALWSPDPKMDLTCLWRRLSSGYQPIYGNAFTENSIPGNEYGFFTGITLRPAHRWEINMYLDVYKFPWLKYRLDRPGNGKDFLVQLNWKPSREVELYARFKAEAKLGNVTGSEEAFHLLANTVKQQMRIHVKQKTSKFSEQRARIELLWWRDPASNELQKGWLSYVESRGKGFMGWDLGMRLQYFETEGYATRIYAYENDLPFGYSVPAFYDKGFKYYLTLHHDVAIPPQFGTIKKIQVWAKYSSQLKGAEENFGPPKYETRWSRTNDFKIQCMIFW